MAKIISPFVGSAKGKLGGAVYYTRKGGTYARQRVADVANPQTEAQMITRVILSTVSKAYRAFMPLCNHSFQGKSGAAENHQEFMAQNTAVLRARINDSNSPYTLGNFNAKGFDRALINRFILAKGSLPAPVVHYDTDDQSEYPSQKLPFVEAKLKTDAEDTSCSYAELLETLGVPQGTQMTVVAVISEGDDAPVQEVNFARIILSPANGNLDTAIVANDGTINSANENNLGTEQFHFSIVPSRNVANGLAFQFRPAGTTWGARVILGYSVILSVNEGGTWKRSDAEIGGVASVPEDYTLGAALDSYQKGVNSSFYLNGSNRG